MYVWFTNRILMIADLIKKLLGIHPQQGVKPLKNLIHVGSKFHGYHIPKDFLKPESICYLIGAGDDISFDTELKVLYDAQIYIFDPTPEGIDHFKQLKIDTAAAKPTTIDNLAPFTYRIGTEQLEAIHFVEIGVWDEKTTLKFYDPVKENYASHSVYLFTDSDTYIEAPVDRLSNLMQQLGHTAIDMVKMEIEGAEYTVIDTIVKDKLDVKLILVEFDEVYNTKDKAFHFRIKKACKQLMDAGYVLIHSTDHLKRSFLRKDIYEELKAKE